MPDSTCPTCGTKCRINDITEFVFVDSDMDRVETRIHKTYEPLTLDALERAVVEAAIRMRRYSLSPSQEWNVIQQIPLTNAFDKALDDLLAARAAKAAP